MSDLKEEVHEKAVVAETALEEVDTLWARHPKKIVLAVFVFLVWGTWQIRYELLDYTQDVQKVRHQEMRYSDSEKNYVEYLVNENGDTIGDVLNEDTLYYGQ